MGERETIRAFRITGTVQGVGYRWWAWHMAEQLGVRGTVRNCPDGSVEVIAAGEAAAVERFRARLAEGPPAARVEAVNERPAPDPALPTGFEILR